MRWRGAVAVAVSGIALCVAGWGWERSRATNPQLVLWAWERAEDLSYADPRVTEVAYLAATVRMQPGGGYTVRPRRDGLRVSPGTRMTAVVRIEPAREEAFRPDQDLVQRLAAEIASYRRDAPTMQLDFDARVSDREGYAALLRELRRVLPGDTKLSMTALASWCAEKRWLDGLPVDEAVPMLFRMGKQRPWEEARLRMSASLSGKCAGSVGYATDEWHPALWLPPRRRTYVFSRERWDEKTVKGLEEQVR